LVVEQDEEVASAAERSLGLKLALAMISQEGQTS